MVSTEGLVPITRAFLASYYDKYPFTPLSADVSRLSHQIYAMATTDLLHDSPPTQGLTLVNCFCFLATDSTPILLVLDQEKAC